jgi:hypothetical protein
MKTIINIISYSIIIHVKDDSIVIIIIIYYNLIHFNFTENYNGKHLHQV